MLKLIRLLKPYKTAVLAVFILLFLQSVSELYLPTLMSDIVNIGIVKGDIDYIYKIGLIMLLISALGILCSLIAGYIASKVAVGTGRDLRSNLFSHIETFSLHEFDKIGTPSLITRTTNDINQVQNVFIMLLRMFITAPIMCIGGTIMAVSKNAKLSVVIIAAIPILALAIVIMAKRALPIYKSLQKKLDKINAVLRERLNGVRVIRAFNRSQNEAERFYKYNKDLTDTALKVNQIMAIMMPLMLIIMNITSIAIVWFGALRIDSGNMQIGDLMAFLQYVMQIMFSLVMLSMMFVMIPRAAVSAERINEVLMIKPEITDLEVQNTATQEIGHVVFENVIFSYPGAEEPALKNISFEARPGEVTAIIGGTGAGKSTLMNLIPRFYDVDEGSIFVDGVDIRKMSQEKLREKIGYVPQQAVIFSGSIGDNITFGNSEADDDKISKVAEIAQASEFIQEMPEKFEHIIAKGGTNISGGQKQRISIARALIRNPEIYIFDDTFSALDFKTDANLRGALKSEIQNSTVFIVAQRVSTVMHADRIIVLNDGEMVGMGTHAELLKSCNVYREIYSSQTE